MELSSKHLGPIAYEPGEILHFPGGLFGFEDETRFLLLPFEEGDDSMLSLQSVHTPALAFIVMNPFPLCPAYAPVLSREQLAALHAEESEALCYYVLCAAREPVSESSINLRCPIVINDEKRVAMQAILEDCSWGMRQTLSALAASKEESAC